MTHLSDCDLNDANPDGIRKPCNCAANARLELRVEPSGCRHYLDDIPVHCGDFIEIQLGGGAGPWLIVRYEATFNHAQSTAVAHLYAVGGRIIHDADARFRWPVE